MQLCYNHAQNELHQCRVIPLASSGYPLLTVGWYAIETEN
jgi:hypothetical protein